jgi:hypothetical protein
VPNDPPPLTRTPETFLLRELTALVTTGKESDCDALAEYIDDVAYGQDSNRSAPMLLKQALGLLTPKQIPVDIIPGILTNAGYKPLNPNQSPSGFQSQCQDQIPNTDQAHHFAGFFQLGFTYGLDVGTSAATWWEKLEWTPGNTGDINLGAAAARIGAYVASGVLPVNEVGQTIRDNLCQH